MVTAGKTFGPFMHTHGIFTGWVFIDDVRRIGGSQVCELSARFEIRAEGDELCLSVNGVFRSIEHLSEWLLSLEAAVLATFKPAFLDKFRSVVRILIALADQVDAIDRAELYPKR